VRRLDHLTVDPRVMTFHMRVSLASQPIIIHRSRPSRSGRYCAVRMNLLLTGSTGALAPKSWRLVHARPGSRIMFYAPPMIVTSCSSARPTSRNRSILTLRHRVMPIAAM